MWIRKKRYNAIMESLREVDEENTRLKNAVKLHRNRALRLCNQLKETRIKITDLDTETEDWVYRHPVYINDIKKMTEMRDRHKMRADRNCAELTSVYHLLRTVEIELSKYKRPRDKNGRFVKK